MPNVTPRPKAKKRKAARKSTSWNKDLATRGWSRKIRSVGRCELRDEYATPCDGELEAAHIIPRRYSATRTYEDNGIAACGFHHRYCFDAFPGDQARVVDKLRGDGTYQRLVARARGGIEALGVTPYVFWQNERARFELWDQTQEQTP